MRTTPVLIAALAFSLAGCGGPANPFEGEYTVSGADWFHAESPAAVAQARQTSTIAAEPRSLGATSRLPRDVEQEGTTTAWVVPSFGRRTIAPAARGQIAMKLSGCSVPLVMNGDSASLKSSFECEQRIGTEWVRRTFDGARLDAGGNKLRFRASGRFTELVNGQVYSGAFEIDESLTPR